MEPTDRKRLNRFGISAFLSLIILVSAFWLYPIWLKSRPQAIVEVLEESLSPPHDNIETMVKDQLEILDLNTPLAEKIENGLTSAIYLSEKPLQIANEFQSLLNELNIEAYTLNIDGIDSEIRIYNGHLLTHRLLFTPTIDISGWTKKTNTTKRERALVSIIISGLGSRDILRLSRFELPLTLAIHPYEPFSLRIAQDAGVHYQEVLIDLRNEEIDVFLSSEWGIA